MADVFTKEKRSKVMGLINSRNTTPERKVRSELHKMGYRFRLHSKNMVGNPDIVLKKYNMIIFIHGCFWHQHKRCKLSHTPKSNIGYWRPKLIRNVKRFKEVKKVLTASGWDVAVIWECQTRDKEDLSKILHDLMGNKS